MKPKTVLEIVVGAFIIIIGGGMIGTYSTGPIKEIKEISRFNRLGYPHIIWEEKDYAGRKERYVASRGSEELEGRFWSDKGDEWYVDDSHCIKNGKEIK